MLVLSLTSFTRSAVVLDVYYLIICCFVELEMDLSLSTSRYIVVADFKRWGFFLRISTIAELVRIIYILCQDRK